MTRSRPAVRSIASFRAGRRTWYVFPLRSIAYAVASLAIVLGLAIVVDRIVLGRLEQRGWTAGQQWARHNKLIEENHRRKTTTNECQPRHWTGQTLDDAQPHRILVMGDSFVWGPPYLTLNHLWWRQLAIELERRGYRDVGVIAVGHPGWSTRRQLECARQLLPELKPDAVIWGYVTNDPDEKLIRQIFDTQDQPFYGQRIRRQLLRLFPNLAFKFELLRSEKLAAQYTNEKYGYAYADWELKLLAGQNFAAYQQTVTEVGQLMADAKTPGFCMTLPVSPSREYYEPRYKPVLSLWRAAGVPVVNTLDAFVADYGDTPLTGPEALRWAINPADGHSGPRSTHFAAVMAADYLERKYPEALGQRQPDVPHVLALNDWLPAEMTVRQIDEHSFAIDYPATTEHMPRLPLDEPTALVALQYPLPVGEIRFEGDSLASCRVWTSTLQPRELYDEQNWIDSGKLSGPVIAWRLPVEPATRPLAEIRFSATFSGPNRSLRMTFVPAVDAEQR